MHGPVPLPGDVVWIRRRRWRVERVSRDRHVVRLDVAGRDRRLTFFSPFDRAFTRAGAAPPRPVRAQHALARLAHFFARADDMRLPSAAVSARADILPHQLEPAMAMLAGRSRVLIADDVGLGKTVQAGLIIAELARRDAALRVIVLVPAALREQWTEELRRRFGLSCLTADRAGLESLSRAGAFGDNPWQRSGTWIASADFLKQQHVAASLPPDPWDLVVIDEAHAVCGESDRYDLANQLAARSRRVLLLTATPHGGDEARFARLVNLGKAGPDPDVGQLTIFRRTRAEIGGRPERRVRWHLVTLSDAEIRVLEALRAFERTVTARARETDQALLLLSVFRKRALSTMAALAQSLTRRLAWLGDLGPEAALEWTQPHLAFEDERDLVDREEREGLTAHSGLGARQERSWIRRLRTLADDAAREERKVERLAGLIDRSSDPVVVFTEFRDSLDVIRRRLRFSRAVSILHGGQDPAERRHQLTQFLDGPASVLLATDVAGQGLNLQSRARWVVSLELPWNPTRLEQRIGRVDRIGQFRSTHLTLLVARHEAESGLLEHLSKRVLTAQRSFASDALADVAPPEPAIRAALLKDEGWRDSALQNGAFQRPLNPATPHDEAAPVCRRWTRPAACVARLFLQRRLLAGRWQAPEAAAESPVRCDHPGVARLIPASYDLLAVFSVPIVDDDDAIVERRGVAIAARAVAHGARERRALAAILGRHAAAAVRRRVAAVSRRLSVVLAAAARRERVLAAAARAELLDEEAQPGLFDQRDARAHEARVSEAERMRTTAAHRLERSARSHRVRAGEAVLELLLSRRR